MPIEKLINLFDHSRFIILINKFKQWYNNILICTFKKNDLTN